MDEKQAIKAAQDYLFPILEREKEIVRLRADISEARQAAYYIGSGWDMGGKVSGTRSRDSRQERAIARLAALDEKLERLQTEQRRHKSELWSITMKMEDRDLAAVLLYRYFLCLLWPGVAHGLELSERECHRLHRKGLAYIGERLTV